MKALHLKIFFSLVLMASTAMAQHGIGTTDPHESAALEIVSPDKGVLIPRLALTSSATLAPIAGTPDSSFNGMIIYNTATSTLNGLSGEGFYVWQGGATGAWQRLSTAEAGAFKLIDTDRDTQVQVEEGGPGTDDDTIRFDTAGAERAVITATGNVGIGTANPNGQLQLSNAVQNRKIVLWQANDNDHEYYGFGVNGGVLRYQVDSNVANHVFYAGTGATTSSELMRITGTGEVGIGTNAPLTQLSVGPDLTVDLPSGYHEEALLITSNVTPTSNTQLNDPIPLLQLARQGTGGEAWSGRANFSLSRFADVGADANTRLDLQLAHTDFSSQANAMTWLSNGNVGIGVTSPNGQLQLSNITQNRKIVLWQVNDNDHQFYGLGVNGGVLRYQVDSNAANHVFYAGTGGTTSNELMRITGTGNVGIGTSNPGQTLTVSGTAQITGALHDSSGDAGTNGQVLSSTSTGTNWIDSFAPLSGTQTNTTLRWDGTAWVENLNVLSDGVSSTWINTNDLEINGATTASGTLEVTGNTTLTSDLYIGANTTASGTLTAQSTVTLNAALVDAAGNAGINGQVLSSTSTGTKWIRPPINRIPEVEAVGTPILNSAAGTLLDGATSVVIQGKYAYVTSTRDLSLSVIDISNPTAPQIVSTIVDTTIGINYKTDLAVVGDYAYLLGPNSPGLSIFNISDPTNPVKTSVLNPVKGWSITAQGHYLYAADWVSSAFFSVDISDPENPEVTTSSFSLGLHTGIFAKGNYVYLSSSYNAGSFSIIDVTNPKNPTLVSTYNDTAASLLGEAGSVYVEGNYAYVVNARKFSGTSSEDGLNIFDVSDPANPTLVSTLRNDAPTTNGLGGAHHVTVQGDYAYISCREDNALVVVDVSDPANPEIVQEITDNNSSDDSIAFDGIAYFALQGNYGYATSFFDNSFQSFSLGTSKVYGLDAGSIETTDLHVNGQSRFALNADFKSGITTGGSVSVGESLAINKALHDSSGDAGTAGQFLSSTATGTNWVTLSTSGVIDDDADTQIQVEEGNDDDTIRLDAAGVEVATFTSTQTNFNTAITAQATATLNAALVDATGNAGTNGQILTSTGTGTTWRSAASVNFRTVSANTTINATDGTVVVRASSTTAITLTLPLANSVPAGSFYILKRLDNGATPAAVNIAAGNATDTIDGNTNATYTTQLTNNAAKMTLQSDGTSAWYIISE